MEEISKIEEENNKEEKAPKSLIEKVKDFATDVIAVLLILSIFVGPIILFIIKYGIDAIIIIGLVLYYVFCIWLGKKLGSL